MKRVLAIVLCMMIVMNVSLSATTNFPDVPAGSWYENHVEAVAKAGIIVGNSKGEFMPTVTLSIDQFVKTMVVAMGYQVPNGETYWASTYLDKARELGIIDSNDYLSQNRSTEAISRAEMSKIIVKTLISIEGEQSYSKGEAIKSYVPDIDDVSSSGYMAYILQVYELGIITGDSNGAFKPYATLSRAEAATVIHRVIDASVRRPFEIPSEVNKTPFEVSYTDFDDYYYRGGTIFTSEDLGAQYGEMEAFLLPLLGDQVTGEVMEYVKTKTDTSQELEAKRWEVGDFKVTVLSQPYNPRVVVKTWELK